ncbi:MAG: AbrB family transcriptional regulator [Pseudomonadota bacterium]
MRPLILTLAIAATGAGVFQILGLPLPLLLGPMFFCLLAALAKAPLKGIPRISEAMRTVLGVAVGSSITPELMGRLDTMAASVAFVPIFVIVIGLIGYPYFRRLCRFDPPTAYYAAMPGGLQDMLVFGEEAGGNPRILSLVHATRVLAIVAILPFLLTAIWGLTFASMPGERAAEIPPAELAIMAASAVIGWLGARRLSLFGASIIGPMVVSAVASLSGLIESRPPGEAILLAQFFIGLGVGVNYVGITLQEVRTVLAAALGFCVILSGLSVMFAEAAHHFLDAPIVEALLAFAPGGQGEMVVLAFAAGVDLAFVVTHHLVRLVVVILGAPLVGRWLR